ncbi:MAG: glycosyltransferase family 4 protein [Chitinophagaceae bacterium]
MDWKKLGPEVIYLTSDTHFNFPDYNNTVRHIIGDHYVGTGIFQTEFGAELHRIKGSNRKITGLVWLYGMEKKVYELRPDFIVSHGIFSFHSLRLLFIAKKLNCPIVFDDHYTINLIPKSKPALFVYFAFRKFFAKKFLKVAYKLIGISDTCIDVMRDYFGLTGPKIEMIPLGTDTCIYYPDKNLRENYRKKLGACVDTLIITYTGKIYELKKIHLIIEALNDKEVSGNKNILILIVGDVVKTYATVLNKSIKNSTYPVKVISAVPAKELAAIYNSTDIAVWPDHLTTSTIDASACGCAIICSHYMTERTKYENGINIKGGNLQELKAALKLLIHNEKKRLEMGDNGIRYVNEVMSWKAIASRFIS